ncbi:MAG: CDP-alcohol phosphatidyltransferase family protein [Microthrixaceae bacterium]|nr:CDP-alcohol phosphatidyltransferase family protein [Microthrixaceae bacterium]
MLDGRFRGTIETWTRPIGRSVKNTGITADQVTFAGLFMSVAAAVTIGAGHLGWGVVLLALTGIPDTLDGAVAKASGTASQRGAFFDSTCDRVTDALLFGGVAWYLMDNPAYHPRAAMLAFAALGSAMLPSYIRAKADALGLDAKGGLVERAERFILLGVGLVIEPLLVPVLVALTVLNMATALQRFVKVWKVADKPQIQPRATRTRRKARAAAKTPASVRWEARRAAARSRAEARRGS